MSTLINFGSLDSAKCPPFDSTLATMFPYVTTAEGRIHCPRCTALSSRTGQQCGRPALKASKTQKCQYHGGRSPGPKTAEGKARLAAVHTVHGQETRARRAERSVSSAKLSQLEDAMHVLGMTNAPRIRGRKAHGYVPIRSIEDVKAMILTDVLHPNRGALEGRKNFNRQTHRPVFTL